MDNKQDDMVVYLMLLGLLGSLFLANSSTIATVPVEDGRVWAAQHQYTCVVDGVLSGDEVVCNGGGVVRLIGVEAPDKEYGEPAKESKQALQNLLPDSSRLRIELDTLATDSLGRVPAYLYLPSGHMLNQTIVWNGFGIARAEDVNTKRVPAIVEAGQEGRDGQRGLWSEPSFQCFAQGFPAESCAATETEVANVQTP